jgi:DNA-binding XRE family transcriptional regulator
MPISPVLSSGDIKSAEGQTMSTQQKLDITQGELVGELLNTNDSFRQEWERSAPARLVAVKLIEYRADQGLSQRQLAQLLDVKQPQIVRWESGEHRPSDDNLAMISGKLGIEFVLSFAPANRAPRQITKHTRESAAAYAEGGAVVRFAAA